MAKLVHVNGFYGDHFIPLKSFDEKGWDGMIHSIERERGLTNPIRHYAWLSVVDNETYEESDAPEDVRAALESVGKRVDKLHLSVLSGWEEGSFLGEPRQEDSLLSQMREDNWPHEGHGE